MCSHNSGADFLLGSSWSFLEVWIKETVAETAVKLEKTGTTRGEKQPAGVEWSGERWYPCTISIADSKHTHTKVEDTGI